MLHLKTVQNSFFITLDNVYIYLYIYIFIRKGVRDFYAEKGDTKTAESYQRIIDRIDHNNSTSTGSENLIKEIIDCI